MKTSLVILAAGIGSRFGGGVKQIAPVGPNGEIIIDYSIRDALEAGFDKVVFVIRRDIEKDFREVIGNKTEKLCEVEYVFQDKTDLPYTPVCAADRRKPWGTTHALYSCRNVVKEPFLIINADDYYGKSAYKKAHDFLISHSGENEYGMIAFRLGNTLSDNGSVTRGVCCADKDGWLSEIKETYGIEKKDGYAVADGKIIPDDTLVSMNMWCFTPEIFSEVETQLTEFLQGLPAEDLKSEHVLPTMVGGMLNGVRGRVKVLESEDTWVGVTYADDKPYVQSYFKELIARGVYPEKL
ncbi:MAG: NTP transferase domain-containing protein [Clostridia bacterium]|nr:NTP transferase domain-containing protein [Clostridia bacterium]